MAWLSWRPLGYGTNRTVYRHQLLLSRHPWSQQRQSLPVYLFFTLPSNKVNFLLKKTRRRMPPVGNTRVPFRSSSCCHCCCNLIPFKKRFVVRSIGCERATVPTGTGVPTDGSGEGRPKKSVEIDSLKPRSPFLRLKVETGDSRSTVVWSPVLTKYLLDNMHWLG